MSAPCRLGLLVALASGLAHADLTLEVTHAGAAADGVWDHAVIGESGLYDLWLYGDAPGSNLWSITFEIGGTPAHPGSEWIVTALGQTDPAGLFTFFTNDGLIVDGGIIEASASAGFQGPFQPVPVPVGPANAILLYSSFEAVNIAQGGRLFAESVFLDGTPGGQVVRSIGIIQTPAPGSLIPAIGACLAAAARRRR